MGVDSQTQPDKSAKEQYNAVVQEYQKAQDEFFKLLREAKTDEEQQKAIENRPNTDQFATRMLEIAQKNPKDAVAVDALVWVVRNVPNGKPANQAIAQLQSDYIANPKIADVLPAMSRTPAGEKLLRAALQKNPDKKVQGLACFYLAQSLKNQSDDAMRQKNTDVAARFSRDAESMFERVVKEFGDIKGPSGTLADAAEPELFEIRFLSIGKTAPEITAEDLDGKKFNLSDYRGKVILLDFWGHW